MKNEKQSLDFLYNPGLSKCNKDLLENSFHDFDLKFVEYKKKNYLEYLLVKILQSIVLFFFKKTATYLVSLVLRNNPKLKVKFNYYKMMFKEKLIELKERINPTEEIILRVDIDDGTIRNSLFDGLYNFYQDIKPNAFKEIYTFGKRKKLLFIIWIGMNRFILSETKKLVYFDDENDKKEEFDSIDMLLSKFLGIKKP